MVIEGSWFDFKNTKIESNVVGMELRVPMIRMDEGR